MKETLPLFIGTVFSGFFAIMNPIANTPIFLSLTKGMDPQLQRAVARQALFVSFVIIAAFAVGGKFLFELFGIGLPAFKITGGILVFGIGLHMLNGKESSVHAPSEDDKEASRSAKLSIAISPLAMPILAGPGTIATAMNFVADNSTKHLVATIITFGLVCIVSYVFFTTGERLTQYLGQNAIKVVTRLMGMILAVIGTQMALDGIKAAQIF